MKDLIKNSDFLGFLAALISLLVTVYLFKVTPKYQLVRERFDKLIYPVFNKIEPYLFKKIPATELSLVISIIEDNMNLAGGKLKEITYYCKNQPSQDNFNVLCRYINSEYDKSSIRLGLKKRSIVYRINREQYQTKFMFIIYILLQLLLFFILFIFAMALFYLLITALDKLLVVK